MTSRTPRLFGGRFLRLLSPTSKQRQARHMPVLDHGSSSSPAPPGTGTWALSHMGRGFTSVHHRSVFKGVEVAPFACVQGGQGSTVRMCAHRSGTNGGNHALPTSRVHVTPMGANLRFVS